MFKKYLLILILIFLVLFSIQSISAVEDTNQTIEAPQDETVLKDSNSSLEVVKTSDKKEVLPGEEITFKITLTNKGNSTLYGVYVKEYWPNELIYYSFKGTDWTGDGKVFNYKNPLKTNQSTILTLFAYANKPGNFTNTVAAGSNSTDEVNASCNVSAFSIGDPDYFLRNGLKKPPWLIHADEPKQIPVSTKATGNPLIFLILSIFTLTFIGKRQ